VAWNQADAKIGSCAQCERAGIGRKVGFYIDSKTDYRTKIALECGLLGIGSHWKYQVRRLPQFRTGVRCTSHWSVQILDWGCG
jgi:hypothetical protein